MPANARVAYVSPTGSASQSGQTTSVGSIPPSSGDAWGPGTPGTETCGIGEALQSITSADGGVLFVAPGTYPLAKAVEVPSSVSLRFSGARVSLTGDHPAFRIVGKVDVDFSGDIAFDGGHHAARGIESLQSTNLGFRLTTSIRSMGNAMSFLHFKDCDFIRVSGSYFTSDSSVVHAEDSNRLDVSGIHARYSHFPGIAPIRIQASGHRGVTTGIHVHDVEVDGGGDGIFSRVGGLVNISGDQGSPHIQNVSVANLNLENTDAKGLTDGLDVARCDFVTIHNVIGSKVNELVALSNASKVSISQVIGHDCGAYAVSVGDPSGMIEDVSDVVVDSCMAFDCGTNASYPAFARCGIGVMVTPGRHVRRVRIQNCISRDTGAGSQAYGLTVCEGAEDVEVSGCLFTGKLAPIFNKADPNAGITIRA